MDIKETLVLSETVIVTVEYKGKKYTTTQSFSDAYLKTAGGKGMIEEVSRGAMRCMREALDDIKEAK